MSERVCVCTHHQIVAHKVQVAMLDERDKYYVVKSAFYVFAARKTWRMSDH